MPPGVSFEEVAEHREDLQRRTIFCIAKCRLASRTRVYSSQVLVLVGHLRTRSSAPAGSPWSSSSAHGRILLPVVAVRSLGAVDVPFALPM